MKSETTAIVFPGQGSQSVGMLDALEADYPVVTETLAEADDALGQALAATVREGPEAELNRTEITQPALLAAGVATWRALRQAGAPEPACMAGHSLGEYTALVCAGALDFGAALRLVAERGRLMQAAVPAGEGAMAAILGLDDDTVAAVCTDAAQGDVVSPVNFNAPGQVVIAGATAAVDRAVAGAKEAGAKRAMRLPVSVPSHCALMEPAARGLERALADATVTAPRIPVIHNVDVTTCADPDGIRQRLVAQLHNPVRWVESVQAIAGRGATVLVEAGPGKVLAGLARRIDRSLDARPVTDPASLNKALEE